RLQPIAPRILATVKRENFLAWMAEQKEPIPLRENGPSSHPPHEHHKPDHDGDQQERVSGFPNQYFTDVHCRLSITEPAARLLSFPVLVLWIYRTVIGSQRLHAPKPY